MLTVRNALLAALAGGLIAGTVDIGAACVIFHAPPVPVLHAIASGLLGHKASVAGGIETAWLGLFLQEFISVVAAGVYCLAAVRLPVLIARPLPFGLAFGFAINLVMTFIIVPLSLAQAAKFGTYGFYANLAANTLLFGPPIAYVARWFASRD